MEQGLNHLRGVMSLKRLGIAVMVLAGCATVPPVPSEADGLCHSGAYRLADGQVVSIGRSTEQALRYKSMNGETGRLYPRAEGDYAGGEGWASPPPPVVATLRGPCGGERVRFSAPGIPEQDATRVALSRKTVTFSSGDTSLRGRLVAPPGRGKVPVVVLVHGSEDTSAVDLQLDQYWLPARGVAVFVYDKRGTGQSQGKYTQDFETLSGDAVAALAEARRLLGPRAGPAGFWGGSQGGWVAPLAARKANADFVLVSFGMAQSPLEEDREEVFDNLRRAGYGEDVLAKAREVTDATGAVMASRFASGYEALEAVKARHGQEPWFKAIQGEYSGEMLRYPTAVIKEVGPTRDRGTSWTYDPLPTLRALDIPMLWVLAGDDIEAPSATTLAILRELQRTKPRLDVAVYPGTDHGIIRFVEKDGERQPIGYARSYLPLVLEWLESHRLRGGEDAVLYDSSP
jgi:hypothetical protein